MAVIPQFKMNQNDPSNEGIIEGSQEQTKRRFVVFKGTTANATPTELFLEGITNYRLKLNANSALSIRFQAVALAPTAGNSAAYTGEAAAGNFAGTVALIGAGVFTAREGNAAMDLAFTADDTNDALIVTVTGVAATTIYWEVQCWVAEVNDFGAGI